MGDEDIPREEDLEDRQGPLYPVGRALRRTYDAENHDSLGTDLTGLMLQLARIDTEDTPLPRGAMPVAPSCPAPPPARATPSQSPPSQSSWWRGAMDRLLR